MIWMLAASLFVGGCSDAVELDIDLAVQTTLAQGTATVALSQQWTISEEEFPPKRAQGIVNWGDGELRLIDDEGVQMVFRAGWGRRPRSSRWRRW